MINEWCKEKDFRIINYTNEATGTMVKSPICIGLNSAEDFDKKKNFSSLKGFMEGPAIKFNLKSKIGGKRATQTPKS